MYAWPFLVSRNKYLGFKVIVAPQFLNEQALAYILREAAGGEIAPPGRASYREVHGSEGATSLVFRVVEAKQKLLRSGENEDALLRDENGRPIELIEGFVLWEKHPDVRITEQDLQFAHEQIVPAYREFWKTTEELFPVQSSTSFPLVTHVPTGKKVALIPETPFIIEKPIRAPKIESGGNPPSELKPAITSNDRSAFTPGLGDESGVSRPGERMKQLPPDRPSPEKRNGLVTVLSLMIVILVLLLLILLFRH